MINSEEGCIFKPDFIDIQKKVEKKKKRIWMCLLCHKIYLQSFHQMNAFLPVVKKSFFTFSYIFLHEVLNKLKNQLPLMVRRAYNVKSFKIAWTWIIFFYKKLERRIKYIGSRIDDTYQLFGFWKPTVKKLYRKFPGFRFHKKFSFCRKKSFITYVEYVECPFQIRILIRNLWIIKWNIWRISFNEVFICKHDLMFIQQFSI